MHGIITPVVEAGRATERTLCADWNPLQNANHNPRCLVYRSEEEGREVPESNVLKSKFRSHNRLAFLFIGAWLIQSLVFGEAVQTTFEFHNGFWVNLHHFLYEQAKAESSSPSSSPEWLAALDYYRREVIKRDLLTDQAAKINNQLFNLEDAPSRRTPACRAI